MKRSTIEKRLNEAMQRHDEAKRDEWYYQREVKHHDAEASRLRKTLYKHRAKKDRAEKAIINLSQALAKATE